MSEPSPIGKVCILGLFFATPFILVGVLSWMIGNEGAMNFCAIAFTVVATVTTFCAMIVWLRTPEPIVTPLLEPEGSSEAQTMRGAPPITTEEVMIASQLTDDAFMADLTANVPTFEYRPGEPA